MNRLTICEWNENGDVCVLLRAAVDACDVYSS